jgi:3-oxoacyl-[acyl-carrier protein] reductase
MGKLEGKVAIVTGASRGIGAAIAQRLATEGARVVINYARNEQAASQVASAIHAAGGEALLVRANVSDEDQVEQLFQKVDERFGRLDILINNAGTMEGRSLGDSDRALFQHLFDLNVWSAVSCSKQAVRRLQAGGRIINLGSLLARQPFPNTGLYAATKGAVEALTRALAVELGPRGITVNAVSPGLVETDLALPLPPEVKAFTAQMTPLQRNGRPTDVADVVAFLASEEARWITGQSLCASGGYTMY